MFRIKICGITNVDDALYAVHQGTDALGLNFYNRSSRFVSPAMAVEIVGRLRAGAIQNRTKIVGVFVNEPNEQWQETLKASRLDASQFHGDELPEQIAHAKQFGPVVKAFRCQGKSFAELQHYLKSCQAAGGLPDAILLDAYSPHAYGGTGEVIDWHAVREQRDQFFGLPIILAGGLTPDNVAEAIRTARPDGVDVASGVEASPGKKDSAKVRDFIAAAREELDALPGQ